MRRPTPLSTLSICFVLFFSSIQLFGQKQLTEEEMTLTRKTVIEFITAADPNLNQADRDELQKNITEFLEKLVINGKEDISARPELPFDIKVLEDQIASNAPRDIEFDLRGHAAKAIAALIDKQGGSKEKKQ